ncbi:MAG: acetamidase/formamidase family protein, partial [Gammaproteobacteria bacterium]
MHGAAHTIHGKHRHYGWDNSFEPALTIAPGTEVAFEALDGAGGQLGPDSTAADIATLDFEKVNPVNGPIFVDGAEPGDALKLTLLDVDPSGWGWTAIIPGFGLLADDFTEAALNVWTYDKATLAPAAYGPGGRVPLKPFAGTVGLAPAEAGLHSVIPPRRVGGNMDTRDIALGSTLYLPVEVPGALLSVGDTHAAQGDGEVCGTALESPLDVLFRIELEKGANIPAPRFDTDGPVTRHADANGYFVTTGVGPDLMAAARDALRFMIDELCRREGMQPEQAYMLCSVCADLRITEIVDQPNWIVAMYFPRVVFA